MKTLFISFLLLLSFQVFGVPTDEEISFCQKEGAQYGDGTGRDELPQDCEAQFLEMAKPEAVKKSTDQKLMVFGFKNVVFVKDSKVKKGRQNIIAGLYTELKDVVSISIDETHKEISVLEASGDILFFSSLITGNVAPLRILRTRELQGSFEIHIDPEKNEIFAYKGKNRDVLVYSRLANIHGREGHKNLSLKRRIKNRQLKAAGE